MPCPHTKAGSSKNITQLQVPSIIIMFDLFWLFFFFFKAKCGPFGIIQTDQLPLLLPLDQAPPTMGVGWAGGQLTHFQETWINFPTTFPQGKAFPGRETTRLKPGHSIWYLPICLSVCLWDQQPPASSAPHQPQPSQL